MESSEILTNVAFYVFAVAVAAGAVGVAVSRNIVRSAFALLAVLFGAAALYAMMKADFIAAVQVIIYVGGILVLIIFAVMLTHRITDVNVSNESTPGPAAFCACLCLLFALIVVILAAAREEWTRGPEAATVRAGGVDATLLQYQSDGRTGMAWGGNSVEDAVVLAVRTPPGRPEGAESVEFRITWEALDKDGKKTKRNRDQIVPLAEVKETGPDGVERPAYREGRAEFTHLPVDLTETRDVREHDVSWEARFLSSVGNPSDEDWFSRESQGPQFRCYPGITEPAALALAGPYLLAFEVVSVLLLAALVGAAFLARKEVKP